MSWDPTSDAWTAGFIDGEGSFCITKMNAGSDAWMPRFHLGLRADEAPVIRDLADVFGGSVSFTRRHNSVAAGLTWTVAARADLRRLCDYLDHFPLRAKKARDYAIWREAVRLFVGSSADDILEAMLALRDALTATREYVEPLMVVDTGPTCVAIARRVGLDPSTVSRALRGGSRVRPETAVRILAARDEMVAEGVGRTRLRLVG